MRRFSASIFVAVLCAAGTPVRAADLVTVVQQALGHDADLAQARAAYVAAQEAVPQARAALLPQVSAGWGRSYNSIDTNGFPRQSYWQNGWTVSLTQPVFDWTRWTAYRQADYVEARGAVDVDAAQQAALLRAVRAYFDELAAEDEVKRAAEYGAAVDAHYQVLQRNRAAGEATVIDMREAQTTRDQATLQQTDAQNALQAKRRTLEQATGVPFDALARLPDGIALPRLAPEDVEAWAAQAKEHGYGVQQKQLDWQIAKLDVSKAEGAHYPSVYATGTYTPAGAASGYARPTTTTTGMLSISIPLYAGGATQSRVRETQALQDKAQEALVSAVRAADSSARDNYARYQQGRTRVEMLARLVASCRETLAATRIGYKVGTRTSIDVLRAIDTLYATQRDLFAARYDTIVALMLLKGDTSTLSLTDVVQINTVLH
ncbi:TolC family outer membrane protein [Paraburkholderia sp. Tr-20389]|uniref:TolC family outer membrane protein n=1 Tax=Paraburkholderia sp. Tr-20389 TaxID=2703903 RepID=UPI001980913C|nr:TolC family outer membrane protein [Paraburkholderia sp. Tr-20389]MBN3757397.1 TolC family outer membrane protein [Paraburkholderia sp. Tr-20389]